MSEPLNFEIYFGNAEGFHEINSESLSVIIESIKEIADELGVELKIDIGVPHEGSWKTNLVWTVISVAISPCIIFLTGESLEDLARKGNQAYVKPIIHFIITRENSTQIVNKKSLINHKNRIYRQLIADKNIDSFGLGDSPHIPRKDFNLYIDDSNDENEIEYLGITKIIVSSPDWKQKRSWRGEIYILEERLNSFVFQQDLTKNFWEMVRGDKLDIHPIDFMDVQLIKQPRKKVQYLVIRVLSYNNQIVDTVLDDKEIKSLFPNINIAQKISVGIQAELF